MKSFKQLLKYFEIVNTNEAVVIEEDQVIIVKDKKENKETVYFYFSYKDLQNPSLIIDRVEKYKDYQHHAILTYVGFSYKVFPDFLPLTTEFKAKININNIEKLSCLGVHQLKMSLLFLKVADTDTYYEILKQIVEKIKTEKVYKVIPYGFETDPIINKDLQTLIKG